RPTPEWSKLTVPDWFAWPLVGAAAISLVTGGDAQYLARNAAMILAVPYFFLGLTVVHALARRSAVKGLLLGVFYVVLVLFTLVAGAIVAGLGMIEQWVGLRERIASPPGRKE
ncbi:MAG: YybS family protein, partial [Rhodospirillales bacterium]|nr:YybS family protein [Rhodospirillales bacterium]